MGGSDRDSVQKRNRKLGSRRTDLVADVQSEEQNQHASGGVPPVVFGPTVMDVFEEGRIEDLDLKGGQRKTRSVIWLKVLIPLVSLPNHSDGNGLS